jgi:hypothetical protein
VGLVLYGSKHISKNAFIQGGGSLFVNMFKKIKKWFLEFF